MNNLEIYSDKYDKRTVPLLNIRFIQPFSSSLNRLFLPAVDDAMRCHEKKKERESPDFPSKK